MSHKKIRLMTCSIVLVVGLAPAAFGKLRPDDGELGAIGGMVWKYCCHNCGSECADVSSCQNVGTLWNPVCTPNFVVTAGPWDNDTCEWQPYPPSMCSTKDDGVCYKYKPCTCGAIEGFCFATDLGSEKEAKGRNWC